MKKILFVCTLLLSSMAQAVQLGQYSCISLDKDIAAEDGSYTLDLERDVITLYGRLEYFITDSTSPFIDTEISRVDKSFFEYRRYKAYRVNSDLISIEMLEKTIDGSEIKGEVNLVKKSDVEFILKGTFHSSDGEETWEDLCTKTTHLSS